MINFEKIRDFSRFHFIWLLIGFNLLLKLPFLFINVRPSDVSFYYASGWLLLNDILPYGSFDINNLSNWNLYLNSVHPNGPFNYLYYSAIIILFGDSVFAIKFTWLIAEIIISIYLYRIVTIFSTSQKAKIIALLYTICIPCYFPGILVGCDELITSAFALMALFYFFEHRPILAGFLLSLGFSYKMYPIFFFLPILLYCFANRLKKDFVLICSSFIITYLIIIFPYLILIPETFFQWTFGQANRLITISYSELFYESWFFQPLFAIPIINLQITAQFLFQCMIMFGFFGIDFIQLIKSKRYDERLFFRAVTYYICMLPVVSFSYNYRYFQWLLPPLLIFLFITRQFKISTTQEQKRSNFDAQLNNVFQIGVITAFFNYTFLLVALYQFVSGNLSWIPFGTLGYNNYIISFAFVYSLFYVLVWYYFRDEPTINNYNHIGFFQGIAGLTLYLSFSWREFHTIWEYPFLYVSICSLVITLILIIKLLFKESVAKMGKKTSIHDGTT